jgi:hypothetical protein
VVGTPRPVFQALTYRLALSLGVHERRIWRVCPRSTKPSGRDTTPSRLRLPAHSDHAFVQYLRRDHYELGLDVDPRHRFLAAFTKLALAI